MPMVNNVCSYIRISSILPFVCKKKKWYNKIGTRFAVKAELKVVGNWLGWVFCFRGTTLWWPNRVQVSQGHTNRVSVLPI